MLSGSHSETKTKNWQIEELWYLERVTRAHWSVGKSHSDSAVVNILETLPKGAQCLINNLSAKLKEAWSLNMLIIRNCVKGPCSHVILVTTMGTNSHQAYLVPKLERWVTFSCVSPTLSYVSPAKACRFYEGQNVNKTGALFTCFLTIVPSTARWKHIIQKVNWYNHPDLKLNFKSLL